MIITYDDGNNNIYYKNDYITKINCNNNNILNNKNTK